MNKKMLSFIFPVKYIDTGVNDYLNSNNNISIDFDIFNELLEKNLKKNIVKIKNIKYTVLPENKMILDDLIISLENNSYISSLNGAFSYIEYLLREFCFLILMNNEKINDNNRITEAYKIEKDINDIKGNFGYLKNLCNFLKSDEQKIFINEYSEYLEKTYSNIRNKITHGLYYKLYENVFGNIKINGTDINISNFYIRMGFTKQIYIIIKYILLGLTADILFIFDKTNDYENNNILP